MAEQMRPASPALAPDPSFNYERSHPEREAGQGRLDAPAPPPARQEDKPIDAVKNRQEPGKQVNAEPGADGKRHARERGKQTGENDLPVPPAVKS